MTGWFEEKLEVKLGRAIKIQYNEHLESFRSEFQKIDIYDTVPFGKMLVHDDVIMVTEADEATWTGGMSTESVVSPSALPLLSSR